MKEVVFKVYGTPCPKARPRLGRGGHTFTPKKTLDAEKRISKEYLKAGNVWFEGSIEMTIDFIFEPPASWSLKKQNKALNQEIDKVSRPDVDNLAKTVLDALNGVAFKDDSQITKLNINKRYGEESGTIIKIKERE